MRRDHGLLKLSQNLDRFNHIEFPPHVKNFLDSNMASRIAYKTTFDVDRVIQPIYTGGSVALEESGRLLVTTLGEDALVTDLETGKQLVRIPGVCAPPSPARSTHVL